ncbi:hypothetical protein A9Q84_15340 [Halobacteriovorax marinus]|uniref:Lipoprotein n=1 Tax=Halobacteriovorax marinus TaxID=97084 RepID=A0A1Y5F5E1_9BACT|nr:hypothetical protein A9Q84_15340 [Halobacteriovorax marinus]
MKTKSLVLCLLITLFVGCETRNETIGAVTETENSSDTTVVEPVEPTDPPAETPAQNCTTYSAYLGADLILNGSFEEGHSLGNNRWGVFPSVGAWHADTTYNDAGIEIQTGQSIGGIAPSDGDSKLEFDAHARNGFTASDVAVYQDIDTDAAGDYILYFDYSPRVGGNTETNGAEVFFDGQLIATLNAEVVGWQTYALRVSGAGDATRVSFKGYIDNNTVGGYLDNVHLKKIVDNEEDANETVSYTSCVNQ